MRKNVVISRDKFNEWLQFPQMISLFKDAGICTATNAELFDVLDVDMGGELEMDELTGGLMRLRGPITKTDIVAVRLKTRYMTYLIEEIWQKICSDDPDGPKLNRSMSGG